MISGGGFDPIPLRVARTRPPRFADVPELVRHGVPLSRGVLSDAHSCVLTDRAGRELPVQGAVTGTWPDGSVRWLLIDCALSPSAAAGDEYFLAFGGTQAGQRSVAGRASGHGVRLASGELALELQPNAGIVIGNGSAELATVALEAADHRGITADATWDAVGIEWNGPVRATAVLQGRLELSDGVVRVEARVSASPLNSQIVFDVTAHNPRRARHEGNCWELGDEGSMLLCRLALVLRPLAGVNGGIGVSERSDNWQDAARSVRVYQESSGGDNWQSRVHLDRTGQVPLHHRGYLTDVDGTPGDGLRAQPAVHVAADGRYWGATLLRFWEEFPSQIAASSDGIVVEFWPAAFPALHELQGGERKTRTVVLAHGRRDIVREALAQAIAPSRLTLDLRAAAASMVLPAIDAPEDPRHTALLNQCLEGEHAFGAKRERIDEYGWRNFGDLHADHESAFVTDGVEFVSHYNNQYDAVYGFGLQYLRTADSRWWRLMDDLARHVSDIDVYHTDEDKAAYNHGMFWHTYHYLDAGKSSHRAYPRADGVGGGGPAAEQNYNAGLALHFHLTGWTPSRDTAIGLAQWVIDMDDGARTPFRYLSRGDTGWASASGEFLYHGPGRAGGNSILALLVGFELSGERRFLDKAETLIGRCIHPQDDLAALNLLDAERRWYYTVFLEAVTRYLWTKHALGECDAMYEYARRALLHYARWMCVHEYPYLEKPEILEFPTETWSAQDMRKSEVLARAALWTEGEERATFLAASRRFFEDVLTRLPAMPTSTYTRPLVLMLTRGYAYLWTTAHPDVALPPGDSSAEKLFPIHFVPQKVTAIRRAKWLAAGATTAAIAAVAALFLTR